MRDSDDRRDRFRALYGQHYAAVLRYAARRVAPDAACNVAGFAELARLEVVLAGPQELQKRPRAPRA